MMKITASEKLYALVCLEDMSVRDAVSELYDRGDIDRNTYYALVGFAQIRGNFNLYEMQELLDNGTITYGLFIITIRK